MSKFVREIKFIPHYESVDCKFFLKGEKGIIQFCIRTGWNINDKSEPAYGYDVGYHSPVALYSDQKPMEKCSHYETCYYDGSSMYAENVFHMLLNYGEEAVWKELESAYERWLGKKDDDN